MKLNSTEELITDIKAGKMVIVMDDADRENEGDFIMAAECVTAEDINFMTRYGRGLVCMPITKQRCQQLNLPLMVPRDNNHRFSTNFTVSIEAAKGVTTGISAADRATTIRAAVAHNAKPQDIVQPGHIFPIMAQPGGVLTRAGHTEASCDLAALAGLEKAGVLIEILNEDGSMARKPDLEKIAAKHNLKIGTIADLISYRVKNEQTVGCVSQHELETDFGKFQLRTYLDKLNSKMHFALVKGEIKKDTPCPVRVHQQEVLSDLFAVKSVQKSWSLQESMSYINQQKHGVVVILAHTETTAQVLHKLSNPSFNENTDSIRIIGTGARILQDIGVQKMLVLSPPKRMNALSGFGLEVIDYVPNPNSITCQNQYSSERIK